MRTRERRLIQGILLFISLICFIVPVSATQISQAEEGLAAAPRAIIDSNETDYVMYGENGTTLLVKPVNAAEYDELMDILYPHGTIDDQGLSMEAVPNEDAIRAEFVANHTKAYAVNGLVQTEVALTPFTIELEDESNGVFNALMYRCIVGTDTFIFPSEWGNHPFGFLHSTPANVYLAYTDIGIWLIDAINGDTQKLTNDSYAGASRAEISNTTKFTAPGNYLVWIDGVTMNMTGHCVIYRTNRDADSPNKTSVWKIDLDTKQEAPVLPAENNNDIVGFITDEHFVVGALNNTRMVGIFDDTVASISLPNLPNMCIKGVGYGKLIYTSYQEDSPITTAFINKIDDVTGDVQAITSIAGYLDGVPNFSPSGSKIAFLYGVDNSFGTNDVCIVDANSGTDELLSETRASAQHSKDSSNNVSGVHWLDDDTVLVRSEENNPTSNTNPISTNSTSPVFGSIYPTVLKFNSPLASNSSGGFVQVNSKWNQPRLGGSNPHKGVDLNATSGTNVYAPYCGWITHIVGGGQMDIRFFVDANKNGVRDDGDYCVDFYHLQSREREGYKSQGQLIGKSGENGSPNQPHLHFGIRGKNVDGDLLWFRNQPNYRHLSQSCWKSGMDLDIFSQVNWKDNIASLTAYIMNEGQKEDLAEVRIYYRTTSSGAWTDGGTMNKSGDTYTYDFSGKFSRGTNVYWMVRLKRSGINQAAFCPAKYHQPNNNPNSSALPYAYLLSQIT